MDDRNAMAEAEAQLYRRIQELRARARGEEEPPADAVTAPPPPSPVPDLRTLLARAEAHVTDLREAAADLSRELPDRIEQAVERMLDDHTSSRRMGELRDLLIDLSSQVDQLNRDLLMERLGRVEDLELVVELISSGVASLRQDMAGLTGELGRVTGGVEAVIDKLEQPMQVTLERPRQGGVRDLFRPTEAESSTPSGPAR